MFYLRLFSVKFFSHLKNRGPTLPPVEPSIPSYEEKNGATMQVAKHELSLTKGILFVYIDIAYNTNSKKEEDKNSLEFSFVDVESMLDCVKSYCVYV